MSLFLAVLVAILFAAVIKWTGLQAYGTDVMRRARTSLAVVTDPGLTDEDRERLLRAEAPRLFALLGRIVAGSALALGLPLGLLWLGDRLGWISMPAVVDILMSVDFIVGVTVAGLVVLWWMRRRQADDRFRRRRDP